MKKFLILPLFALLFLASCSKSAKLNKTMDGAWTLKTVNGSAVGSNFTQVITFTKDGKDNGSFSTVTTVSPLPAQTTTGTYTLIEDTKIITKDASSSAGDTSEIVSYSKTTLKLKTAGDTYEFSKN